MNDGDVIKYLRNYAKFRNEKKYSIEKESYFTTYWNRLGK